MTKPPVCKDCVDGSGVLPRRPRPAPHPGPRCATHWRAERNRRKAAAHGRRTSAVYSLEPEDYLRLFEHQGRRCAICRRATGATKRLAVDHDHSCCPGPTSCGRCVRGLVCGPCNSMLAHARDDAELFRRAIRYLRDWPALAI
jgi:hypothetical protein